MKNKTKDQKKDFPTSKNSFRKKCKVVNKKINWIITISCIDKKNLRFGRNVRSLYSLNRYDTIQLSNDKIIK